MLPTWLYLPLFAAAFLAGFVDTIAGGGGLITIPVLLSCGLTPQDALGTNKLQASFGSGSATWHFARARMVSMAECRVGILWTALGALAGALVVLQISPGFLRQIIPFLLAGIALYTLLQPRWGVADQSPRLAAGVFHLVFGLGIGFYDGFFGPGTGSFWAMAYVLALGYNLVKATASTKVMNFTSNAASLAVFILGGNIHYDAGLVMGAGQMLGARLGSRVVLRRGARFIRPVFIAMVLAITARLVWDNTVRR
jgi:hypothetical protein